MEHSAKTCFVIMPMTTSVAVSQLYANDGHHFDHIYKYLIEPAVLALGLVPIPPMVHGSQLIHAEIINKLSNADLVLCDISQLNPNVFFELGVRVALNKPIAVICDAITTIPFDVGILNIHKYEGSLRVYTIMNEVVAITEHLRLTLSEGSESNAMWKHLFQELAKSKRAMQTLSYMEQSDGTELVGRWLSLSTTNTNDEDIPDVIDIQTEGFNILMHNMHANEHGYEYKAVCHLMERRYLVGTWKSVRLGASNRGGVLFTLSPQGDYMCGIFSGYDIYGETLQGWYLGRSADALKRAIQFGSRHRKDPLPNSVNNYFINGQFPRLQESIETDGTVTKASDKL